MDNISISNDSLVMDTNTHKQPTFPTSFQRFWKGKGTGTLVSQSTLMRHGINIV